jgi:hypothetical protein
MTLYLMLFTKLDASVIEEALTKFCNASSKKTFGMAHSYFKKVTDGIYMVMTDYRNQNNFGDNALRSGLQEGLRKQDKTGEVIRIETKKRVEVGFDEGNIWTGNQEEKNTL